MEEEYISVNREAWNSKAKIHIQAAFYEHEKFLQGQSSLKSIELSLLGDLNSKSVLHLQCHFGQDSLSMARMGARVTGVDFSDVAIEEAVSASAKLNLPARFICCDIYSLPLHLEETFDVVFASYGVIGWLPDLSQWASLIARYLKPGGKFVFVEFHPVVWMFDDHFEQVTYSYFKDQPIVENETGTYGDREAPLQTKSIGWNHGLSEVVTHLLNQSLALRHFEEFDYSPYNCFSGMVEGAPGKYFIEKTGQKIPLVYSLVFEKPLD